ncbi:hypothetical protein HPPC_03425 [Helicobacter pylori PeCan4]|nr:hypothetical protein HPPC_03425 [Helicobacter pylori PeCan4]EKE82695.1 hypothetical protein OUE_0778 [Helicobacter pylori R030b]EQD91727.1 hypothetical protein L932_04245 [Helicobacter pylori PZ5026]
MPILAQELKPFPNDEKMILVVLKKHPIHSKRFSTGSFNFSVGWLQFKVLLIEL